jgi:hypothetical protein
MAWTLKATSLKAQLPPGLYEHASLSEIEKRHGENGEFLLWKFAVDYKDRQVTVTEASSTKFSPQAKARRFAEALLRRAIKVDEEIKPESLYDLPCQLLLTVAPLDDGGSVNRVEKVLPIAQTSDSGDDVPF